MVPGRDLTRVRSISSWALLLISCVLCVAEKRLDIDSMRSLVQRRAGSPLLTNWLSNVINEEGLPNVVHEERPHWISKSEGKYHKNNEEDEEGLIIFNSIRGYMENNNSMVELEIHGERTSMVNNLTFTYNGGEEKMELSSPWTGDSEAFIFEADIFDYEDIELSLVGRNGDMQSPVTARGSVSFQFGDPGIQMAFVGSDSKTSVRIAEKVPDSGIPDSVKCTPNFNGTACYNLEKDVSYCQLVTTQKARVDSSLTVCDSSRYIDPLNELPKDVDLMWMEMEMPMDGMNMMMPMLMATAKFSQMPAKMEVIIYADDDPSTIYSPLDYSCEIQNEDKMDMDGTMCHQMLPNDIPSSQEGVQVLVVGLDMNGNVIESGLAHSIVHEDFTAIIVGACLAAVVGMACIVALVGCYVEKRKKKKRQDELNSTSVPRL